MSDIENLSHKVIGHTVTPTSYRGYSHTKSQC